MRSPVFATTPSKCNWTATDIPRPGSELLYVISLLLHEVRDVLTLSYTVNSHRPQDLTARWYLSKRAERTTFDHLVKEVFSGVV